MTIPGGRKVNKKGRATGALKLAKRNKIVGQFSARLVEMLESPAFRVLSPSGHRILARLEIELGHHGGQDNGKLPVTFDDFVDYGIHRHSVAPAIRECEALGFIEITQRGRAGNADFRCPIFSGSRMSPQPVLRQHMTGEKSRQSTRPKCEPETPVILETKNRNRNPVAETAPSPVAETAPQTPNFMVRKPSLQPWYGNHHYYIYRGRGTERVEYAHTHRDHDGRVLGESVPEARPYDFPGIEFSRQTVRQSFRAELSASGQARITACSKSGKNSLR